MDVTNQNNVGIFGVSTYPVYKVSNKFQANEKRYYTSNGFVLHSRRGSLHVAERFYRIPPMRSICPVAKSTIVEDYHPSERHVELSGHSTHRCKIGDTFQTRHA